jgi:predicted kinase
MRRMPDERRLSNLVGTSRFADDVRSVARAVAVFHASLPPITDPGEADPVAGCDAWQRNWDDNYADIEPLVGDVLQPAAVGRARALVSEFLAHRAPLFEARRAAGLVRDGHGDLTADDIYCLDDGPRILDCLAFDSRYRINDVLADVAFLAMDLDRLAGFRASSAFLGWYTEFSNEHHPGSLAHHYVAYRANVRVKVAAIRYLQGDRSAADQVRSYHALSLSHLERAALSVIVVGGSPGTGKSTLARGLSNAFGAMLLSSDELRKDLAGRQHDEHGDDAPDEGIYTPEQTDATYTTLLDRARSLLERGESVVLDASWSSASWRERARALAETMGARAIALDCFFDADVAKRRIAARIAVGGDPSDARPELVDVLRARREPWPTAARVDTHRPPEQVVATVVTFIERRA